MQCIFITGTDTDCGKTYITRQLVSLLRKKGHNALGIKPIASGVSPDQTNDISALEAANTPDPRSINRYAWPEAIAPHIAAKKHRINLNAKEIALYCQSDAFKDVEYLLIEGAGGLMMPLNYQETWLDVIRYLDAEVIFVVGMKLGCLNHTLLSFQCLRHYNIHCRGWIANCIEPDMLELEENIQTLQQMLPAPCLAINRWQNQLDESFMNMGYNCFFKQTSVSL